MKYALSLASLLLISASCVMPSVAQQNQLRTPSTQQQETLPIDIVFCVDGSGSMDPEMAEAKQLMRSIVQQFAQAPVPTSVRIGLIEYGNQDTYYKMMPLTNDFNKVYDTLEKLDADIGGMEWVGRVVEKADQEMKWRPLQKTFRTIYILGNETASQGAVDYRNSVPRAVSDGIAVNAVQCQLADFTAEKSETWQEIAALGGGSYFHYQYKNSLRLQETSIGDQSPEELEAVRKAQFEKAQAFLALRNMRVATLQKMTAIGDLDSTLLQYGSMANFWSGYRLMYAINKGLNGTSFFSDNIVTKIKTMQSNKSAWDLVDASRSPDFDISRIRTDQLPFEMRAMSDGQKQQYIQQKAFQRAQLAQFAGVAL